jgi:hypothetical protein
MLNGFRFDDASLLGVGEAALLFVEASERFGFGLADRSGAGVGLSS